MKNIILIIIGLVVLSVLLVVLVKREKIVEEKIDLPKKDTIKEKEVLSGFGKYSFDINLSEIVWEGKKTFIKEWVDAGDIKIESGYITLLDDKITEGQVTVDMNSITAKKTGKGDGEDMLSKHLKSADFFDVENFPTSNFSLTSITPTQENFQYEVEGDLTIKETTRTITFPANIYLLDETLVVEGEIVVDRTDFDVRFGSTNFFKEIGDNAIDNNFILKVKLVGIKS